MSAFCVFGMTFEVAVKRAEKKLGESNLSMEEWKKKVHELAERILIEAKPTQVSPPLRRAAVRQGMDRGRAQNLAHLCAQGHGPKAQEGQARQPCDQQSHRPASSRLGAVLTCNA